MIAAIGVAASPHSSQAADCTDSAQALSVVRKALTTDTPSDDRAALLCVAQALAALDARLTTSIDALKTAPMIVPMAPAEKSK